MYYGWTFILLLPAFLISIFAQYSVHTSFNKYSKHASKKTMTGAEVALWILRGEGITDVLVVENDKQMHDRYDPKTKTLRLSQPVFNSRSVAAQGVAAHEAGHAIQHASGYFPFALRGIAAPVAAFGGKFAWPLLLIAFILPNTFYIGGNLLINASITLYAAIVFVSLVTLPVELNASRRAAKALLDYGIMDAEEIAGAKRVLCAAALTYVASATNSVISFVGIFLKARKHWRNF